MKNITGIVLLTICISNVTSKELPIRTTTPRTLLETPLQCKGYEREMVHTMNRQTAVKKELKLLEDKREFYYDAWDECITINAEK
jgi:hypothetical protein